MSNLQVLISEEPSSDHNECISDLKWGRAHKISFTTKLVCLALLVFTPFWVSFLWLSCTHYKCSVTSPVYDFLTSIYQNNLYSYLLRVSPSFTWKGFGLYIGWVIFQALMYVYWPSNIGSGQATPAGNILTYRVNGLRVWIVTHILFILGSFLSNGYYSMDIIQQNWGSLLVSTNIFGYLLTMFAYMKAYYFPTQAEDRKFSGSFIYDLYMGIELNPRIGKVFDFKLFFNGRPGIIGWTLVNFSFAVAQYKSLGYVTNSMVLLNVLHAMYVLDFFYFEDWYLRTIDIAHDHFGYYLAWGDTVWLPFTYTLQSHYIYRNPISLSWPAFSFILLTGILGYYIFRNANNQKDLIRKFNGNVKIWGKQATYIRAAYTTADGKEHVSILLTSGFWGISRHFNYIGDLLMCLSFAMSCGLQLDFIPYYYLFYMSILLIHRISRDQDRCKAKYGIYWDQYCAAVPYKLLPYIY
ncbi:7-dehydrocholesterol reductase [Smittium mucronatum]|uniref:7-dehydrocholesterol reductase n=1 Tax=Smittium mucronatum TaxID=133383 RepID=A0A1R0GR04_9FUNG|nr:7-dehydrocholesterol reductase [Smittium mucronatum]